MLLILVCVRSSPAGAAVGAAIAALIGHLPSLAWIYPINPMLGMAVPLITCLSFGVAGFLIAALAPERKDFTRLLWMAPALFVALETARSHILPPYLGLHAIGSGILKGDLSLTSSAVLPALGIHGATALVVLGAGLGAVLVLRASSPLLKLGAGLVPVGVCALLTMPVFYSPEREDEVVFVGVQTQSTSFGVTRQFLSFTNDLPRQPEVIVWPERSGTEDPSDDPRMLEEIMQVLSDQGHPIIVGFEDAQPNGDRQNSAAMWVPAGHEVLRVSQTRPDWFSGFVPGHDLGAYDINGAQLGFVIGTDLDHESVFRRLVMEGATAIVVMAIDDGWGSIGGQLHLTTLATRASEVGRDIGRVTQTGPSSLARSLGQSFNILERGEEGFLSANLHLHDDVTLFVRGGWLFPYLVGSFLLSFLVFQLVRRRPKAGQRPG